jgi:hypothetical protein
MLKVSPILALAGTALLLSAAPVLAAGPLITSGVTFVDGKDAEPPPWPKDAPQTVPQEPKPAVKQQVSFTRPPAAKKTRDGDDTQMGSDDTVAAIQQVAAAPPETARTPRNAIMRIPPRYRAYEGGITFARTMAGAPVTIIWDR